MMERNGLKSLCLRYYSVIVLVSLILQALAISDNSCDVECATLYGINSECQKGECTNNSRNLAGTTTISKNPFEMGCLYNKYPGERRKRVCNSDDPEDAKLKGMCIDPDFDYMEIRIQSQNWESSIVLSWILQILLSEILGVPTSIERGRYFEDGETLTNFYDSRGEFDVAGVGNDITGFNEATRVKDCIKVKQNRANEMDYKPCSHVTVESWYRFQHQPFVEEIINNRTIIPPQVLGLVANNGWYIPKFTAERDPTLLIHFGLQGEENREKLAERFLLPTTWKEYCDLVSQDNCTTYDGVARRGPKESEYNHMFFDGLYTGHFRKTEENDCKKHPKNCTGVIIDYPCSWISNMPPIIYHHNIPLRILRYTSSQLSEIWYAANATKSDIITMWWSPDSLSPYFLKTDTALTRVSLPKVTRECLSNRIGIADRCSDDVEKQRGTATGACDEETFLLHNLISAVLEDVSLSSSRNNAVLSPALDALKNFKLLSMNLEELFTNRFELNLSSREATCEWVANNLPIMNKFIPLTFPRYKEERENNGPLLYICIVLASFANILVLVMAYFIHKKRHTRIIQVAQYEFLCLVLAGCLLIASGTLVLALPPSSVSCVISEVLINFGYTLELVPLLVKVAAINHLLNSGKRMKRTKIRKEHLFRVVFCICGMVLVFLALWTIKDRPKKIQEYSCKGNDGYNCIDVGAAQKVAKTSAQQDVNIPMNNNDSESTTIDIEQNYLVSFQYFCESRNKNWHYAGVAWHFLMLLSATILAYQSSSVQQEFNETKSLTIIIYSSSVFVALRLITYFLSGHFESRQLTLMRSLIYSIDIIFTVVIYFLPKVIKSDDENLRRFAIHRQQELNIRARESLRSSIKYSATAKDLQPSINVCLQSLSNKNGSSHFHNQSSLESNGSSHSNRSLITRNGNTIHDKKYSASAIRDVLCKASAFLDNKHLEELSYLLVEWDKFGDKSDSERNDFKKKILEIDQAISDASF